jgi:16S rRNA (uracil1498-N3)-methyltransferase
MASIAQFFLEAELVKGAVVPLDEATAKHIVQVLRKQTGDPIRLCNGMGYVADAVITDVAKKRCTVTLNEVVFHKEDERMLHLGVAFTKNNSRNEWLLEKATELGVKTIIPLITTRTEKEHIRHDRAKGILISAMLQSQGYYLPSLSEPTELKKLINTYANVPQKLVAHCMDGKDRLPLHKAMLPGKSTLVLIGPEGDLTDEEVNLCEANDFAGISLGTKRLRTETAAMTVCAYFNMIDNAG